MNTQFWGFVFFCFACLPSTLQAQAIERHMNAREGDQAYTKGAFQEAEMKYRQANELEKKPGTTYNLGNSLFLQDRYDEAVKHFEDAVIQADEPKLKARAFHNLGNAHLANQDLENAVRSYIESLKLNPEDMDTKKNLTMALQRLQQQKQQQQQQQDQQDQQQQQEEQQQQQQDQQNQKNQQAQQQDQENEQDAQMEEQRKDLSKEEAEELLKIIEDEDQKVQEKLRKTTGDRKKPKKDW